MTFKDTIKILLFLILILSLGTITSCDDTDEQELPDNVAFPGAPPTITHQLFGCDLNCLTCHESGTGDAQVTPHPEREICVQCHLPQQDVSLFDNNTFSP